MVKGFLWLLGIYVRIHGLNKQLIGAIKAMSDIQTSLVVAYFVTFNQISLVSM